MLASSRGVVLRALHAAGAVRAAAVVSKELVDLVLNEARSRKDGSDTSEAVKRLQAARSAKVVDHPASYRAGAEEASSPTLEDAAELVFALASSGPDMSSLPARNLHRVESYAHLADTPLGGFSGSELHGACIVISAARVDARDILTQISHEAEHRVDELPAFALVEMAEAMMRQDAPVKVFLRAASRSLVTRAHTVPAELLGRLLYVCVHYQLDVEQLAHKTAVAIAVATESPRGEIRGDAVAGTVQLLVRAGATDIGFLHWVRARVRDCTSTFSDEPLVAVESALASAGLLDAETRSAIAVDRARRAREREAATLNGPFPEDFGTSTSLRA